MGVKKGMAAEKERPESAGNAFAAVVQKQVKPSHAAPVGHIYTAAQRRGEVAAMTSEKLAFEMVRRGTILKKCPADLLDGFPDMRRDHSSFIVAGAAELKSRFESGRGIDTNFVEVMEQNGFFDRKWQNGNKEAEPRAYTTQVDHACAILTAVQEPKTVHAVLAGMEKALGSAGENVDDIAALFAVEPIGMSFRRQPLNRITLG